MPSMLTLEPDSALRKRFWAKVERGSTDECWPWSASIRNGYGAIKHRNRVYSAHRVAHVLAKGEPPEGMVVAHKCDNRSCCNRPQPTARMLATRSVATYSKNARDANARGDRRPRGEEKPNAIFNERLVVKIWLLRKQGLGQTGYTGVRDAGLESFKQERKRKATTTDALQGFIVVA